MSFRSVIIDLLFNSYKRLMSPLIHVLGVSRCIFLPTCSEYAYLAVERHGWLRGSALAVSRLTRCHPFSKGGLDPVP